MYDLLLKNGALLDPATGRNQPGDLAIDGSLIAAICGPGSDVEAARVIDVSHLLVMPGFIDLHVHVYSGVTHYGVDADPTCLGRGVTTALDAGSAGAATFPGFRKHVIEVCQTRLVALLNISAIGLVAGVETDVGLGELEDLRYCHVQSAIRTIEGNRDKILGVKIRVSDNLTAGGRNALDALIRAREVCDAVGLPLMVHAPSSSLSLRRILDELRPGDVLTHSFHGRGCGIMDGDLQVLPEIRHKVDEGLLLDVGHGKGGFTFEVARAALDQGVAPHTISSDLHAYNLHGPVFDLVTTVNKFLHLGMELSDALRRVTANAAHFLHMEDRIGVLQPGAIADVVVMELVEGEFDLVDTSGVSETSRFKLEPRFVFRAGKQMDVAPRPVAAAERESASRS